MPFPTPPGAPLITGKSNANYHKMCALVLHIVHDLKITHDMMSAFLAFEHYANGSKSIYDFSLKSLSDSEKSTIKDTSRKIADFVDKAVLRDVNIVWNSVFYCGRNHLRNFDRPMAALFFDLYGMNVRLPAKIIRDDSANWGRLISNCLMPPQNVQFSVDALVDVAEFYVGKYEVLWYSLVPESGVKTISRAILEISLSEWQDNGLKFEMRYISSRPSERDIHNEVRGVLIATANCLYLIGSESSYPDLVIFSLEKKLRKHDHFSGLMLRKHTEKSLYSSKVVFIRVSGEADETKIENESAENLKHRETFERYAALDETPNRGNTIYI